jgi:hypothetical protein
LQRQTSGDLQVVRDEEGRKGMSAIGFTATATPWTAFLRPDAHLARPHGTAMSTLYRNVDYVADHPLNVSIRKHVPR